MYLTVYILTFTLLSLNSVGCDDSALQSVNCPYPPIECLWCIDQCPEGQVLEKSPCGCCEDKCVPETNNCNEECPKNICTIILCPLIKCAAGYISVPGGEPCGCCPRCIRPRAGEACYKDFQGNWTCGDSLKCCRGKCTKALGTYCK